MIINSLGGRRGDLANRRIRPLCHLSDLISASPYRSTCPPPSRRGTPRESPSHTNKQHRRPRCLALRAFIYRVTPTRYAVFFAAFTFAQRALCAAAIFLRAAAESVRLPRIGTTFALSRTFAQRALWAAAILARADADSFLVPIPFPYALPKAASAAPIPRSSLVNRSCSFFNNRTTPAKLDIQFSSRSIVPAMAA